PRHRRGALLHPRQGHHQPLARPQPRRHRTRLPAEQVTPRVPRACVSARRHAARIHTVSATSVDLEVAMSSSRWVFSLSVRREFFDRVCGGSSLKTAAAVVGVSQTGGRNWWREAGAMTVHAGGAGGLATIGNRLLPGGGGNRLNDMERVQIMRLRDAGLKPAQIAARIGRHRATGCGELALISNADGDYHALIAP